MSDLPPPSTAPAGWYPDPYTGGQRYFDGRAWVGDPVVRIAPPTLEPKVEHPDLPLQAALGALGVLTVSLVVGKFVVDALVGYDWPLLVYIVVATAVSYGPSIAWGYYVRGRWGAGRSAALGWRFSWMDLAWGPLTWLCAVIFEAVIAAIVLALDIPFTSNLEGGGPSGDDRTYVIALLVAAVIAAPIVEETVFRGLVMRGFLSRMHPIFAIVLQGVLFGAAHYDPVRGVGNIGLITVLAGVGVALGVSAYLFRRLGPVIIAHGVLNAVVLTLALTGALDDVDSPFDMVIALL